MDFFNLPRRKIRYWLFRFKAAEESEISVDDAPVGLREYFEELPEFPGWDKFAVSWDLPHLDNCSSGGKYIVGESCSCGRHIVPLRCVAVRQSIWTQWRTTIREETTELPLKVIDGSKS